MMVNKKSLDSYKSKRRIFSTENNTPFMTDFFTRKDGDLLIPRIFDEINCHDELIKMLNNSVKYCAKLFPHYNDLTPGKGDEKDLFDKLQENFKQTKDNVHLLRHLVENLFARLKHFRSIATRFEKLARNFKSMLFLASSMIWVRL